MSKQAHLTYVFDIPGPKEMTFGMDFESAGDYANVDLDALCNAAITDWNVATSMKSHFTSGIVLDRMEAYAYDVVANAPSPPAFKRQLTLGPRTVEANVAGTFVGVAEQPHTSAVITFRTAVSTRRTRGRIYLPPPPVGGVVDQEGQIDSTWITNLLADWPLHVAFVEASTTGGNGVSKHVVQSLMSGARTEVTSYTMTRRIDTQRRRLNRALEVT